jgi:phosphate starvation-inducible protein PhoH and related proteins
MSTIELTFEGRDPYQTLVGLDGRHLSVLGKEMAVQASGAATDEGGRVSLEGPKHDVELAAQVLRELYFQARRGRLVFEADMEAALKHARRGGGGEGGARRAPTDGSVRIGARSIAPRTPNQRAYMEAMRSHDIVFSIGPAGTGKTYLAMAVAISAFRAKRYKRIVLARPAVEAGEKLGFLPGDLVEKVNPYLRPLFDALHDLMDFRRASQLLQEGVIEVAPLAFMRGRTLNDAFVILDEAQNTTVEQMKMLLTRIGLGSQAVITGDVTQIDLPDPQASGLIHAARLLRDVDGIRICQLERDDIVRHPLVQAVVEAYERGDGGGKR